MKNPTLKAVLGVVLAMLAGVATAGPIQPETTDFGPMLERFTYPWPVETMTVDVAGTPAQMAFMDVAPKVANGTSVVLLHGKNFCGATWESSARALLDAGYRVLIPDQIGFCKSSKPRGAQYSLPMLAALTRQLMQQRGIERATILGHSMGGMLAMRFAIQYPEAVERLVLVNPLGLRDRAEDGVPYAAIGTLFAAERKTDYASIKAYQLKNYYHGSWKPAYDRWVWMLAGMYQGAGRDPVAMAQARTSEMIYAQPVAHELYRIAAPTVLIVGNRDETAFGRQRAPANLQAFIKAIPLIAPAAAKTMPNARLVTLDGLGHSPQVEDPPRFERALLAAIRPQDR